MKNRKSGEIATVVLFVLVGIMTVAMGVSTWHNHDEQDDGSVIDVVPFVYSGDNTTSTNSIVK